MKSEKLLIVFLFLAAFFGTACRQNPIQGKQTTGLSNTSWQLTGINNKQVMTASMGEGIYLTFEPYQNQVTGFAGCNRFFGNYRVDEAGNLTFDAIGSTKIMCRNMPTETEFLNALRLVNRYEISDATLKLFQDENPIASFSKIPFRRQ